MKQPAGASGTGNPLGLAKPLVPNEAWIDGLDQVSLPRGEMLIQVMGEGVSDAEFRASVMLMVGSWNQKPMGTLPAEDDLLSRISDHGKDVGEWKKVKEVALRNWRLCTDGRYHHPLIAKMVLELWLDRVQASIKGAKGNASRWGLITDEAGMRDAVKEGAQSLLELSPKSRVLKSPLIKSLLEIVEEERPWVVREKIAELEVDIELLLEKSRSIMGAKDNQELADLMGEKYSTMKVWRSRKALPQRVVERVAEVGELSVEALMKACAKRPEGGRLSEAASPVETLSMEERLARLSQKEETQDASEGEARA